MSAFFEIKRQWQRGERAAAKDALDAALRPWTGAPAFGDAAFLIEGGGRWFEDTVENLLTATLPNSAQPVLTAPFARAWAGVFTLDPHPRWIDLLGRYDFHQPPTAEGFDDEEFAPPENGPADFAVAADAILAAARAGVLVDAPSRDGRPWLGPDDPRPAELPLADLPAAFAAAPTAFWARRLADDPAWVAAWFAHDLIGRYDTAPGSVVARWRAVRAQLPAYEAAGLAALDQVADADAFVAIDVGRAGGRAWLDAWRRNLRDGDGAPP